MVNFIVTEIMASTEVRHQYALVVAEATDALEFLITLADISGVWTQWETSTHVQGGHTEVVTTAVS